MSASNETPISPAEIARVARDIWESEGRPDGRDLAHWHRAKEILEGQASGEEPDHAPRPVQPGFEDTVPGTVPKMKETLEPGELREDAGGRFARQLAEAPEKPGPRNPKPMPSTNAEGYVTIPNKEDAVAGAASDDPLPPPAKEP